MKLVQQSKRRVPLLLCPQDNDLSTRHGELLPPQIRAIYSGCSGSGKTNALISLLYSPSSLKFKNVYLYSKTLNQPKYVELEKIIRSVKGMSFFGSDEPISLNECKPYSILIFDDVGRENQKILANAFSFGRHKNIDLFYLCQTYTAIPKQMLRDNANVLAIFRTDNLNLKHIFENHVAPDMTFVKFQELCRMVWNTGKHAFVFICKDFPLEKGRYRLCYDTFIEGINTE